MRGIHFFSLCILTVAVCGLEPVTGVHRWQPQEVAEFLTHNSNTAVAAEKVQNVLGESTLFKTAGLAGLGDENLLERLGITAPLEREQVRSAIQKLQERIAQRPANFFEWRVAHLRLCDTWIVPMLRGAPRFLAIWARYFTENPASEAAKTSFEKADDVWDSTSPTEFWLSMVFAPYYPHAQIARKFHVTDNDFFTNYCDTVFSWWTVLMLVTTPIAMLNALTCRGLRGLVLHFAVELGMELAVFLGALFGYHIGWFILPAQAFAAIGLDLGLLLSAAGVLNLSAEVAARIQAYEQRGIIYLADDVVSQFLAALAAPLFGYVTGFLFGSVIWNYCIHVLAFDLRAWILHMGFIVTIYISLPLSIAHRLFGIAFEVEPSEPPPVQIILSKQD